MIKKKSVVAAAMAMSMMASLSTTAYAGTIASGVTPIVANAETSGANYSAGATGTNGSETSTGIVEATGALEGTEASAGSTNQAGTQATIGGADAASGITILGATGVTTGTTSGTTTSAASTGTTTAPTGSATSETLASVNASTMQAITAAGGTDTTHALVSSSGSSAGTPADSIGMTSFGPTVPGVTGSSTGSSMNNLFGTGTTTSGSSTVLNALSTVPLPAGYYCSNVGTYTYQEMQVDLNILKATYPKMQMDVLGNTIDGRQLYHVVVGNPSAPHKILVHGGIHAREYISSQVVMREIVALLEMQQNNWLYHGQSVATLLQNTCIHFVPMVNPDGITLVQGGIDALNTQAAKTMVMSMAAQDQVTDLATYLRKWKNNINGVNLNRNFDAFWQEATPKVDHPSNMFYKGTGPESEVESKALANLCRQIMPDYTISYHTQGRVIYWYFGETGNYKAKGQYLANVVHQNTGYTISDTWSQTDAAGFKDWAVQKLDIPSVTIELGRGTSPVDESQITQMWTENDGILPDLLVGIGA